MEESTTGGNAFTEMDPIAKLHDLRKKIDGNIHYAKSLKDDEREEYSKLKREISIVFTKLQEAKMWAGKCLEALGSELPEEYQHKFNQ